MATYKKPLKHFDGRTLGGYSFTAEDADGKRLGSYAIDAFEAHKTITAEDEGKKVLVPFHAVKTAMYATMTADAEKADAYCGGGTEPVGEVWYTGTLGECDPESGWAETVLTKTDKAKFAELLASPSDYSVSVNGTEVKFSFASDNAIMYSDTGSTENYSVGIELTENRSGIAVKCPTDITTVEVTVTHK